MANVLYVAWKVDSNSSFVASARDNDVNFFYGFSNQLQDEKFFSIYPHVGRVIGIIYFLINRLSQLTKHQGAGPLVTVVKRNRLNEWLLNLIIHRFNIDRIEFHWVGYGFFPSKSMLARDFRVPITITHHDWYHFTEGAHVPLDLSQLVNNDWSDKNITSRDVTHRFVSRFQREKLSHSVVHKYQVEENKLRREFVELAASGKSEKLYAQRIKHCKRRVILFVGVLSTHTDYKGESFTNVILGDVQSKGWVSVGVACSQRLNFDVTFSKLNAADLAVIMSLVDLVVVPSRIETYSMVAREAQELGTPVVFRANLAPTSFSDQVLLYPANDDTDESLIEKVLETIDVKSDIFALKNAVTEVAPVPKKTTHCFCYVIYGREDRYRRPVFETAQYFSEINDFKFCVIAPARDFDDVTTYFNSLENVEVFQVPSEFNDNIIRLARFLIPLFQTADFYHFRDSDSVITDREVLYLSLITPLYIEVLIFRDHRLHFSPILAGMISFRRDKAIALSQSVLGCSQISDYNYDQTFLVSLIYHTYSAHVATSAISYRLEDPIFLKPSADDFAGMPAYWKCQELNEANNLLKLAALKTENPLIYVRKLSGFYQRGWFITFISWCSYLLNFVSRLKKAVRKLVIG